jgi:hypothetical protein
MWHAGAVIVAARFNGPPASGNGGYTAGLLGTRLAQARPHDPAVTVTLRKPPPLETPYEVERTDDDGLAAYTGGELIVTAVAAPAPPAAPAWADPATAGEYPGFSDHPFPTCYVCGPKRDDGLAIFPGPLPDGTGTAAIWRVPADADAVTVWAALDCPGGWAIISPGRPYVLGRITVAIDRVPAPGEECVVVGECTGIEGRKGFVRSGLFAPDRRLLAAAEAVWIAV